MSGKVSAASSASAGANISGGKAAAATGAAVAGGKAGSDGVSAAPAARVAAGAGGGGRFSSAMADAAYAGEQSADAHLNKPATNGAADASAVASPAVIASSADIGAEMPPVLGQGAAKPNPPPVGATGNAGGGKAALKTGPKSDSGAANSANNTAPVAPADPVALAMLLAASGMQLSTGAGTGSAADAASGTPATAGDGAQAAVSVTRLAARITAGLPASDPALDSAANAVANAAARPAVAAGAANSPAPSALAQPQRDAPTPVPDTANSATGSAGASAVGTGLPDKSAAPADRSAIADTAPAQSSIMTDSSGLPELVRSFANSPTQTPLVEATIAVPVANGGWPQAVAAQVHWFVSNDVQSATLRLSPEHLGPVEVRIDVHDSQVNVNFSAAHAETRVALEQTVPRLREIFAGSGLTLGQASVQQDPRPGSKPAATQVRPAFTAAQVVEPVAAATPQGLGLVDEYA
jgi:flagellar hook-length control protein FliK